MAESRRRFQRKLGQRRYRKLFVIVTEGSETEPLYFSLFNSLQSVIHVDCIRRGQTTSSPLHMLRRIENYLDRYGLEPSDEAWLVVDRDQWDPYQLDQLHVWTQKHRSYGLALSNPKFEYWLLLHFEDGTGIRSSQDCDDRLKRYLPNYNKKVHAHQFSLGLIDSAIHRARKRDFPPCADWPRSMGITTVYRLVERLIPQDT